MAEKIPCILPVYLNQRAVFDLVAMLQGGISTVTRVTESASDAKAIERDVGAAFGLNKAFSSLLKIDLSAKRRESAGEEASRTASEERVHTPASLFYVLRNLLLEKNLLISDEESVELRPGAFFEFSAALRRNPVVEIMDAIHQVMTFASVFASGAEVRQKKGPSGPDTKTIIKQMEHVRDALRSGDTIDLTTEPLTSGYRAVITAETQYLNDPSMADLVDGTFTVMGKVTRVIPRGGGLISLVRKTALATMPTKIIEQSFSGLVALSAEQGFRLPALVWGIDGPVIQLLPVAIYT